jgi:hypothetical protein
MIHLDFKGSYSQLITNVYGILKQTKTRKARKIQKCLRQVSVEYPNYNLG